ncbi:MAG: hypothetical protein KA319_07875, partial [Ferruginibacter sp.]|nr:hypothetical protein [Ferruginibacter sp.]
MQNTFQNKFKALHAVAYQFTTNSAKDKLKCFNEISKQPFVVSKVLFDYHVVLLFTLTHAENQALLHQAEAELQRLTNFIKKHANHPLFADSGLPYTTMLTRFTQDAFNDLVKNNHVQIELESLNNDAFDLNSFLNITM